jgi:hypothetical protein
LFFMPASSPQSFLARPGLGGQVNTGRRTEKDVPPERLADPIAGKGCRPRERCRVGALTTLVAGS